MISPRKISKLVAASLPVAGFLSLPSMEAASANSVSNNGNKVAQLANNPKEVQILANLALNKFKEDLSKGPTNIWLFSGVCAVMAARTPKNSASRLMEVIPSPGVVHILDPKTKAVVTEAVAWNQGTNSYDTGLLSVVNPSNHGQAYDDPGVNQQFNLFLPGAGLVGENVEFSSSHDAIVTTTGQVAVMDVASEGVGNNIRAFANDQLTQIVCNATTDNPPNFKPVTSV